MYTVLLADDEPTILEFLSSSINWKQFGVDTILTAADGYQALQIRQNTNVDLLITDIKMPNMDGLTLLKEVRLSYPDTHCILLTAYGEFEYARTAIQLGVENYLLKPLKKEELEATIEKALDNIYTSRKNSWQLFQNNILLRWTNGTIAGDELSERCSLLNINLYLPEYCVACATPKKPSFSLSAYQKLCSDSLSANYEIHFFKDEHNRYVTIIGGSNLLVDQLAACFTEQASILKIASRFTLAIGSIVKNAENLTESYQSACRLLEGTDPDSSDILILTDARNFEMEIDHFIQKLTAIFQQPEESLSKDDLLLLTEELLSISREQSSESVREFLSHCLCLFFSRELPNVQIF